MNRTFVVAIVAGAGLYSATAAAERQVFAQPQHAGYRVDVCRIWGNECGQAAADHFCLLKGFDTAAGFKIEPDIGAITATRTIGDGLVCDQPFCDGFEFITCTRPGPGTQSSTTPPAQPQSSTEPPGAEEPHYPPGVLPDEPPPADPVTPPTGPPVQPPPPLAGPPWTPKEVMDKNIDVQGQYALFRLLKGDATDRVQASHILSAVKAGALKGIYQEDQQVPALRAVELGKWWGQILPKGIDGVCMNEPTGKPPIIAMRRGTPPDKAHYDNALLDAWQQCGIPPLWPVRPYDPTAAGDPPATGQPKTCTGAAQKAEFLAKCEATRQENLLRCERIKTEGRPIILPGGGTIEYGQCQENVARAYENCLQIAEEICR